MDYDAHWTLYVCAFLLPVITVLGIYLAYQQWQKARYRMQLDLFEKRLAIYRAAGRLVDQVTATGRVDERAARRFLADTREAKWLLNDAIHRFLHEDLYGAAARLQSLQARHGLSKKRRRKSIVDQAAIGRWLVGQYATLDILFDPFLRFPGEAASGSHFAIRALSRGRPPFLADNRTRCVIG